MRARPRQLTRPAAALTRIIGAIAAMVLGVLSAASTAQTPPAPPGGSVQPVPGGVSAENLAIITIKGPIDGVTSRSFERRMNRAIEGGANAVVIELDTPGGVIASAMAIGQIIETCPVHTIAWVHDKAISAGSFIAIECDEIVISKAAIMGDAGAVFALAPNVSSKFITDPLLQTKMLSPILAQVVDSARRNGYDEALVQGLIFPGVETWMVEDSQTGTRYFLTEREYIALFDRDPPRIASMVPSGPPSEEQRWETAIDESAWPAPDLTNLRPASGMMAPDIAKDVNFALSGGAVSTRPDFSRVDASRFIDHGYATDGQNLLTMKGGDMRAFGFVRYAADIDTDADIKAYLGATNVVRLDQTWVESVVGFMTQGFSGLLIRGALIVVFLIAMFIELSMPGVGIPGLIAVCALVLLVGPPMLLNASVWWAVAAIVGGMGLIVLEILVFPGFGIPGILGMIMLLGGLVGTFMTGGALFPGVGTSSGTQLFWAISTVLLALFTAGAAMFFVSKYTRSVPIASKLVLFESLATTATTPTEVLTPGASVASTGAVGIGAIGITTTPLRPSGTAEFGDDLVDVVAEIGFVERGQRVRVVSASSYRVVVEPIDVGGDGQERSA